VLELRKVVKHYRGTGEETIRAVDGVSLSVAAGEFVGLCGPSGAGKSTLLLLMAGMLAPDSGLVLYDGRDTGRLSARERTLHLRRNVGLVGQTFHVRGGSAINQASAKLLADGYSAKEARAMALPWLERVGLGGRTGHSPKQMSMGERQRLAVAQALVNQPDLVLADEPTGNLDSTRSSEILGLLREISRERQIPVVLATHDQLAEHYVDRMQTLMDGQLQDGAVAGLLSTK
jgi:putative ABC transport system ATP-binding protein